jgi:hypothetical protein
MLCGRCGRPILRQVEVGWTIDSAVCERCHDLHDALLVLTTSQAGRVRRLMRIDTRQRAKRRTVDELLQTVAGDDAGQLPPTMPTLTLNFPNAFDNVELIAKQVRSGRGNHSTTGLFAVVVGCPGCGQLSIQNGELGYVTEGGTSSCGRQYASVAILREDHVRYFVDFEPTRRSQQESMRFRETWKGIVPPQRAAD